MSAIIENIPPNEQQGLSSQLKRQLSLNTEDEGSPKKKPFTSVHNRLDEANIQVEGDDSASEPSKTQTSNPSSNGSQATQPFTQPMKIDVPLSPTSELRRKREKEAMRQERISLTQKLSLARPDLAKAAREARLAKSFSASQRNTSKLKATVSQSDIIVADEGPPMNQERSRALEKQIREDLRESRELTLPPLKFVLDMFDRKST